MSVHQMSSVGAPIVWTKILSPLKEAKEFGGTNAHTKGSKSESLMYKARASRCTPELKLRKTS